MAYTNLFKPIEINSVQVRNRVVLGPMALNDAFPPGFPSEQTKAFYAARAKGGVGLVILGGTFSTKLGWDTNTFPGAFRMDNDDAMAPMSELVERVHAFGAKIFVQFMLGLGRQGSSKRSGVQPVSCTAEAYVSPEEVWPEGLRFPGGIVGELPRELTIPEIVALEDESANSALRVKAAGFDGIEIPCHHGYLLLSFLSPRINKRTDSYGGTLENRMRFLLNSVHKTRENIGPDFPLGVRLCANEHMQGGLTCQDCVQVAKMLEKEGVDFIHLADGVYESHNYVIPEKEGTLLEHGEPQAFKKALKIPVITPSVHDPDLAEAAVAKGNTDMIASARQMLADPEWANKVREGRIKDIRRCDRDSACTVRLFFGLPVRCKINPDLGRERYMSEYYQPPFPVEKTSFVTTTK
jgi:2,4-dienoyl-CoA reductase-like NADH-dependent reductase (Old Yellow Enzyme family)